MATHSREGFKMKYTVLTVILVNLLFTNLVYGQVAKSEADQLQECCADGSKKDNLNIECSNSYKPNPELGPLDRKCFEAFWKCCVNKQASLYCDKGKTVAVQDGHCNAARPALKPSGEPVPGGEMLPECCRLCHEGRNLDPCPAEAGQSLPEQALHHCCHDHLSSGNSSEARDDRHFEFEGEHVCSRCQHECSPSGEHCTCHDGFQLAEDGHSCHDVDECLEANICKQGEECANYHGTYECILSLPLEDTCGDGMVLNTKTSKCEKAKPEAMTEDASHFNDRFDKRNNLDDKPFETRDDGRQETRQSDDAKDFVPSVDDVECPFGFEQDKLTKACVDINECERGDYMCWENEYCVNSNGSYTCEAIQCDKGMKVVDGQCEANQCPVGSHYDEIWEKCEDDDECLSNPCSKDEVCRNNVGSYICEPKENCPDGMRPNTYFQGCVDIDECQDNKDACKSNETCVNTHGSFHCDCARGFEMKDGVCQDMDECSLAMPVCSAITSICLNNHGSYECKCKPGFERDRFNPHQCNNINECLDLTTCPPEATCFDSRGSFTCKCTNDLVLTENNTCEHPAPETEECHGKKVFDEELKGYKCTCPDGFNLTRDITGVHCTDYDECDYGKTACPGEDQICVNTFGSHKCIEVTCPENYIKMETERACVHDKFSTGNCTSGGGACTKHPDEPSSISFRFVTIKSNISTYASKETPVQIYHLSGINPKPHTTYRFDINVTSVDSSLFADKFVKEDLIMQDMDYNSYTKYKEAKLFLTKPIIGPSDIVLTIDVIATIKRGHLVRHINVHRTNLFIYVSAYDGQNFK
ncbi:Fibulin-1 [Halotydeus destructor]|nr:Fibulin-1 [Halotydeus destructor]